MTMKRQSALISIVTCAAAFGAFLYFAQPAMSMAADAAAPVAGPPQELYLIPGWHFDPVWWNTQQHYLEDYTEGTNKSYALDLIHRYLGMCRRDSDYRFVMEAVPYLKPYWDMFPDDRDYMRGLAATGRLDLVGGSYNEPQSTLINSEAVIRNAVYGLAYEQGVMGGASAISWQCDVFGHDPNYPQLMKRAGITASAWARGPFHEWGAARKDMNFPTEFYWTAPDGSALLTHFMPLHYWYGRQVPTDPAAAEKFFSGVYADISRVSVTGAVMLPMVDDFLVPNTQLGSVVRYWNERHPEMKVFIGTPSMFFRSVEKNAAEYKLHIPYVSRDFNPVFPGCAVSFTDVKQANRLTENTLLDAEKFSTIANLLDPPLPYPMFGFDKAWRDLAFLAHHDAVTGSMSDQVYLDLLGTWHDAYGISAAALNSSLGHIASQIDTTPGRPKQTSIPIVVFNPLSWETSEPAWFYKGGDVEGYKILDDKGKEIPSQPVSNAPCPDPTRCAKGGNARVFIANKLPPLGYRVYHAVSYAHKMNVRSPKPMGEPFTVETGFYKIDIDPARGGGITGIEYKPDGKQFIRKDGVGNDLVAYKEYPTIPGLNEGPWHFSPTGRKLYSHDRPTRVWVDKGSVLTRVIIEDAERIPGAATPENDLTEIARASAQEHDAKNRADITIDLTPYIAKTGSAFVRFSDAFDSDGWGPNLSLAIVRGVRDGKKFQATLIPNTAAEKPFLFLNSSNIDSGGNRFADAKGCWVYRFDFDKGTVAKLKVSIANEYLIGVTDKWNEDTPGYFRRQEIFVYNTQQRIDFAASIGSYSGSDWMFRVQFPMDIEGARPVYEVANAAVGRPFGRDADTAKSKWTLADTAYQWVDLSRAGTLTAHDAENNVVAQKAVGAAEIIIPDVPTVSQIELSDVLVRNLSKAGVTATPTRASARRCCDDAVDSSVTDFRISIGMPVYNSFTAQLLGKMKNDEQIKSEMQAEIDENGYSARWIETGDDIPVIIIAWSDKSSSKLLWTFMPFLFGNFTDILDAKLPRPWLAANDSVKPETFKLDPHGAALINRGTPSYIVYPDGTLALTLMRSSSAWPSGLWLDPPRRKAPAGDNFEFENWDHAFFYSLLPHNGDWREGNVMRAGYETNHPPIVKTADYHKGKLPASLSFFSIRNPNNAQAGDFILTSLKPFGYSAAGYDFPGKTEDAAKGVSVRVFESEGRDVNLNVKSHFPLKEACETDFTEKNCVTKIKTYDNSFETGLGGFETRSFVMKTNKKAPTPLPKPDKALPRLYTEPYGPVAARYWRYNSGPAPMGNMPLTVYFRPDKIYARPGETATAEIFIASSFKSFKASGGVAFETPQGWDIHPDTNKYNLKPGGWQSIPVSVRIPSEAAAGSYMIRADITDPPTSATIRDTMRIVISSPGGKRMPLDGKWKFKQGDGGDWGNANFMDWDWKKIDVPGYWEKQTKEPYDGVAWYRRKVKIPSSLRGKAIKLDFTAGVDDSAEVFWEGKRACSSPPENARKAFFCQIPETLTGNEEAVMAIRIEDTGGDGGVGGPAYLMEWDEAGKPLDVSLSEKELPLAANETREFHLDIKNNSSQKIDGYIQIISPVDTWGWLPEYMNFSVSPNGDTTLSIPVRMPVGRAIESSWAIVKVMHDGILYYTEAVKLAGEKK
jgi:alpha-mannosidase